MTKLSDEDQKILRLRFFQGFSVATIARSLDLDQRRLYHRFDKSLHFLKKELQRHRHLVEDLSELLAEGTPLHKIEEEAHG